MKSKKLKKLIQKPLRFHHQDIHDELDDIKETLNDVKNSLQELRKELTVSSKLQVCGCPNMMTLIGDKITANDLEIK